MKGLLESPAGQQLLPRFTTEELRERVSKAWTLDTPHPLPKNWITCPQCGRTEPHLSRYVYSINRDSPRGHRCDVVFKCTRCSLQWTHGVPLPENVYERMAGGIRSGVRVPWREAIEDFADAAVIPDLEETS